MGPYFTGFCCLVRAPVWDLLSQRNLHAFKNRGSYRTAGGQAEYSAWNLTIQDCAFFTHFQLTVFENSPHLFYIEALF